MLYLVLLLSQISWVHGVSQESCWLVSGLPGKVIQPFVATKKLATKWKGMNPQDSLQGLVKGFGMATESVGLLVHTHSFYWKILLMVQKSGFSPKGCIKPCRWWDKLSTSTGAGLCSINNMKDMYYFGMVSSKEGSMIYHGVTNDHDEPKTQDTHDLRKG